MRAFVPASVQAYHRDVCRRAPQRREDHQGRRAIDPVRHWVMNVQQTDWCRRLRRLVCVLLLVGMTACASTGGPDDSGAPKVSDPIEPVNRVFFQFNRAMDKMFLRPLTELYVAVVPGFIRAGIHTLLDTMKYPLVAVNDLLQGEVDRFGQSTARFVTNVVLGFGFLDVAGDSAPGHDEDFGQTLAVWGIPSGPYLMIPFFGPSTLRDGIGQGAEIYAAPVSRVVDYASTGNTIPLAFTFSRTGATAIDTRSQYLESFDELERTSLDFYATIRSLYIQKRRDEIRNGKTTEPLPIPEISFEPEPEEHRAQDAREAKAPKNPG